MKKILIVTLIVLLTLTSCQSDSSDKIKVAVSIVPEGRFVEAVAGDLVDVVVMIPPGNSPANYQPSPKEMAEFNEATVYFSIGVAAETQILESNTDVKVVHLDEIVGEVYPDRYFDEDHEEHDEDEHEEEHDDHDEAHDEDDHDHSGRDPHIWLSPKRVVVMVEAIRDELVTLDPENKDIYEANALEYIELLKSTDQALEETLNTLPSKTFIIYHPSYGYFADDYDLEMVAIESEGKEATIKGMEGVIELAKENNIQVVFYQEEFDSQQAEIIAKEIDGVAIKVTPLSESYIDGLNDMVELLKEHLN